MITVDSDAIARATAIGDWISAMEDAFRDTAHGKIDVPKRMHIIHGENTLVLMPCFGVTYYCTKLVSSHPRNLKKKMPVILGTVILNDAETGEPLAALDGSKLTAMRTAAVGSVGIKYLAPENANTLGIIGLGIQGFHQALFACHQRPIRELRILDRTIRIAIRFRERFRDYYPDVKVIPCRNALELCEGSEIVITATASKTPVVPGRERWWPGKTLIGIGSYEPEMREFPDEIFSELSQIFVDTLHGLTEAGDLVEPINHSLIKKEQVFPISDLIMNRVSARGDTRFFKSVGMAAFDLYGAKLVYENLA
jgi:ornithine cyclodeaminase/alanine dehydrogenase-like protein (mu-crystallin family)